MKNKLNSLIIGLALLAGIHQAAAQVTRFFRISGPAATKITALRMDGTLVWSNAQPGVTYIIQTLSSLPGGQHDAGLATGAKNGQQE
jgi:hypothetical protein